MTREQLAEIRERAILGLAMARRDRAALLQHIEEMEGVLREARRTIRDCAAMDDPNPALIDRIKNILGD